MMLYIIYLGVQYTGSLVACHKPIIINASFI